MDKTFKVVLTMTIVGEQSGTSYRRTTDEELDLDPKEVMAYTAELTQAMTAAIAKLGPMMMGAP